MDAGFRRTGLKARRATARVLAAALAAAIALSIAGCDAALGGRAPSSSPSTPEAVGVPFGTAPLAVQPRTTPPRRLTPQPSAPLGSWIVHPSTQRIESVLGDLSRAAVLIGDSQSEPSDSWVRRGLERAGYSVYFAGSGGTGYSVGIATVHAYAEALRLRDWHLPAGSPRLVVVQGGGNDASRNATDEAIVAGARTLFAELQRTYPEAPIVMVGTLAKSAADGGGRRTQVDALLGRTAKGLGATFISCGDWISRYGLAGDLEDAVHLLPSGRARLAPVLADALAAEGLTLP
ncbi:hypothetical protein GCM10027449_24910 [Sinomonas notoginsengisoli]|uniref:SGNH/GDSL hydrolase family protein n=1 Tax=Sinomonas notoginsengisoli TaxID=1457311 RepID=UPI001F30BE00|nr:SGNH/GDSL hydrolase family protein [Sinomonas notoginsengisoli]